jgi:hypothetical protein
MDGIAVNSATAAMYTLSGRESVGVHEVAVRVTDGDLSARRGLIIKDIPTPKVMFDSDGDLFGDASLSPKPEQSQPDL